MTGTGTAKPGRTLLIVDDDQRFRTRLIRAFEERGYEVVGAGSYDEAMIAARQESPELALVDLRRPAVRDSRSCVRSRPSIARRTSWC
jgi:ActR/RegA family two-component response regulator